MPLVAGFNWRVPLVVLGGGRARRMGGVAGGRSKVVLPLDVGRPECLLDSIVGTWAPWSSEVLLVVREENATVREVLGRQPVSGCLRVQPVPRGTAAALLAMSGDLPERFLVVLGDCLVQGCLDGPEEPFPGLVVWPGAAGDAVRANYAVRLRGGRVAEVEEKPATIHPEQLCGVGVYFFDRALLDALQGMPVDDRGCRELTDGLVFAMQGGLALSAVRLSGRYLNVNTAADLEHARVWFPTRC